MRFRIWYIIIRMKFAISSSMCTQLSAFACWTVCNSIAQPDLYAIGLLKNTHYYSIQNLLCWSKLALLHPRNLFLIFAGREILAAYRVRKFICITIHLANKSIQRTHVWIHPNRGFVNSRWSEKVGEVSCSWNWLLTITECLKAIKFDVIVLFCFLWGLTKLLTLILAQSQKPLLQTYVV